jgi:hypothetical protein
VGTEVIPLAYLPVHVLGTGNGGLWGFRWPFRD